MAKGLRVRGGSPGLVVMGGDSCSKGREFETKTYGQKKNAHSLVLVYDRSIERTNEQTRKTLVNVTREWYLFCE